MRDDPRNAGGVKRYHTWKTIQTQSVAEHSWNVARILMVLWTDAPAEALRYALLHDAGELSTGDAPFPIKKDNPVLKREMDRLEEAACEEMGLTLLMETTPEWRWRVKLCDMLEMWEFGLEEVALGNLYARPIVLRTEKVIHDMLRSARILREEIQTVRDYMKWRTTKTPARP